MDMTMDVLFLVLLVIFEGGYTTLPPYIKPCKMYDDACSLKSGQDAIPTLLKGDEKYHLPSLMPLKLPKIEVESGPNFKLTMTDIIVNGLDTMELVDYTHHRDELAFTMHLKSKRLEVLGNYEINGKLLMMPIEGSGPINVTVENSDFVYTFHIELYDRDGETYFNILPNDELTSSSEHAYFHMENLFNGNKELADNMNKFLNENSKEVFAELGSSIRSTMRKAIRDVATIFSKTFPYKDYFAE
ncbi:protein takeout-like [Sitophilus oryzae]|uniref:Protein takeout-like n=1 Tax=Sitophilus oryzae TaxID=7048 RepID=A0A6J2XLK0_SITOR|nr:protein takeout-like [Sitophilus oryzae]